jgi:hypothetical protein
MITFDQVGELLKIAARYDKRTIAEGDIEAWFGSLNMRRLEFEPCAEAIVRHYAYEDAFITVARIGDLVRRPGAKSAAQALAENDAVLEAPLRALEAPRERYEEAREVVNAIARPPRAPDAPFRHERGHPAMAVRCSWCQARPGNWCSQIVRRTPTAIVGFLHPSRVEAVGLKFTPQLPPRDDQDADRGAR